MKDQAPKYISRRDLLRLAGTVIAGSLAAGLERSVPRGNFAQGRPVERAVRASLAGVGEMIPDVQPTSTVGIESLKPEFKIDIKPNQFGDQWDLNSKGELRNNFETATEILPKAYPGKPILETDIRVMPSSGEVLKRVNDCCLQCDGKAYAGMPFVIYPEKSEACSLDPGIYWPKDLGPNPPLAAHECFHLVYGVPEHSPKRFSPHGASIIVQEYLETGKILDEDDFAKMFDRKDSFNCYRVKLEDSLASLAEEFGVTEDGIRATNRLGDETALRPGQELMIGQAQQDRGIIKFQAGCIWPTSNE